MDCWLASFPRSGNTFFRNILYYVYGVESSTWHKETTYPVDEGYDKFKVVKTHLLPGDLEPADRNIPAIYLVRDGRDAMVSIAHHRSDLVNPGSDFISNMTEAIVAAEGSFFGGWSRNVNEWLERAQLVIKYEDLIKNPKAVFEKVEKIVNLPEANWDNLPEFNQMKSGKVMYGGVSKLTDPKFDPGEFSTKFFRKGKSGGWRDEMPLELQDLFWNYHGDVMERMGYESVYSSLKQNETLDYKAQKLCGYPVKDHHDDKISVIIEATKLTQTGNDGIKRYLLQLLKGFEEVVKYGDPRWRFELLIGRKFLPLSSYRQMLRIDPVELHDYEKVLMGFKSFVKFITPEFLYNRGAMIYKKTDARKVLKKIQKEKSVTNELKFYDELNNKKEDVDLLHIPLPQNSEFLKSVSHKFVVTVHDMTHKLFPQYHEEDNIQLAEEGMNFISEKDAEVICVSQSTADDMHKFYNISEEQTHLVYESPDTDIFKRNVNDDLARKVREKYKLGSEKYFLCLSTIEPRKNLPNTIKAFNRFIEENPDADVNLVISGSFGWKTEHLSKELHLENKRIIFTGFVEDEHLNVIYSEALALCYVSVYEGFGLPPLEAMSCRTPVIYGNNSSLSEIIGDAGLPANADDLSSIKDMMYKLYSDSDFRNRLAEHAQHKSFEFSWRKNIYKTLKVFEQVALKNKSVRR